MEMEINRSGQLWWGVTGLTMMVLYWLSNVVLWLPWSYNPQLGILMMLTVNPIFWGIGIYFCLVCGSNVESLVKKTLIISAVAVGISLISDYLFFAVYMKSKDVWHITTFYGYAWLVVLAFGEAFLLRKRLKRRQFVASGKTLLLLAGGLLLLLVFLACLI